MVIKLERIYLEGFMDFLKYFLFKVHKEGIVYVAGAGVVAIILNLLFSHALLLGLFLVLAVALFFRDPERVTPVGDSWVIAPADGEITAIEISDLPAEVEELEGRFTRVSIFLSVLDIHVNRVPASGTIRQLSYHAGKFLNATLDKASEENERQTIVMETTQGKPLVFVQIAGLIARRIVCDLNVGDSVQAGERFGIIRFGSRMDVYLPEGVAPQVVVGQRAVGGETILADLQVSGTAREGVKR